MAGMTEGECKRAIVRLCADIWSLYRRYNPGGNVLEIMLTDTTSAARSDFSEDKPFYVQFWVEGDDAGTIFGEKDDHEEEEDDD